MDMTVQSVFEIENELHFLKQKIAQETTLDSEKMEPNDPLLVQFNILLSKYEERIALFKDHFMGENGAQAHCEGVTFEQDVSEIEKMKSDLHNLRKELEDSATNTVTETMRSGPQSDANALPDVNDYVISTQQTQESPERRNPTFGTARDSAEGSVDEGDQTRRTEEPQITNYQRGEEQEQDGHDFSKLVNQMRAENFDHSQKINLGPTISSPIHDTFSN